jgi:exonuclease SbcC
MRFKDRVEIEFPENQVTLIEGENGSGKTSILDAICVCLYSKTLRTSGISTSGYLNLSDLVNHSTSNADIVLEFENHGHNYIVKRRIGSKATAELLEDGQSKALGSKVSEYVKKVAIGLDWEGFTKASIILQGEMSSLTDLLPSQRKAAFEKLYGFDKYQVYDKIAKDKADAYREANGKLVEVNKLLQVEVDKIPSVSDRISELTGELDKWKEAEKQLISKELVAKEEKDRLESVHNEYIQVKQSKKSTSDGLDGLAKEIDEKKWNVSKIQEAVNSLPELRARYDELKKMESAFAKLKPAKIKFDAYQNKLASMANDRKTQVRIMENEKKKSANAKKSFDDLQPLIPTLVTVKMARKKHSELNRASISLGKEKTRIETRLKILRKSEAELKETISNLRGKNTCPICLQVIQNPEDVMGHYNHELEDCRKEQRGLGEELRTTKQMIQKTTSDLNKATAETENLESGLSQKQLLGKYRTDLSKANSGRIAAERRITKIDSVVHGLDLKLSKLSFDSQQYLDLERKTSALRREKIAEHFSEAKNESRQLPRAKREVKRSETRKATLLKQLQKIDSQLKAFGDIEQKYLRAKKAHDDAKDELATARIDAGSKKTEKGNLISTLGDLEQKREQLIKNTKEIGQTEVQRRILDILRTVFKNIPDAVLARIRPQIEREGTDIINNLSEGEITSLNLGEQNLAISATTLGESRPIEYFSGGQKTRINMALRVANSRLLTKLPRTEEHTFAIMETLFIDEGDFGSLDEAGIKDAMNVIRSLTKEFNRVIIISHIPAFREIFQGYTIHLSKSGEETSSVSSSLT